MSEKVTRCKVCDKAIHYTTKPPVKCTSCKNKKQSRKRTRRSFPKNKNTKGELLLFKVLNEFLGDQIFINHGFYSFLRSPKNAPLQLDRYYPDIKLAFEMDGQQHEQFTPYIHKTIQNFEYQQTCDRMKKAQCKEMGITLICVSYKHKITTDSIKLDIKKANPALYNQLFGG